LVKLKNLKQDGKYLVGIMKANKDKQLTVLCGHTHSSAYFKPLPNLTVLTGKANYYKPKIYTAIALSK